MSHLLDTNICSAHFRRPGGLAHRFLQYAGRLFVPTVVLGELYTGAYMSMIRLHYSRKLLICWKTCRC